eukprot:scaffold138706_cov21-Tisochrysis_lutea.AAC.1
MLLSACSLPSFFENPLHGLVAIDPACLQTHSLARRLSSAPSSPLEYYGALGVLRHALQHLMPAPLVISEGANTMDMSRLILPVRVRAVHVCVSIQGACNQ